MKWKVERTWAGGVGRYVDSCYYYDDRARNNSSSSSSSGERALAAVEFSILVAANEEVAASPQAYVY